MKQVICTKLNRYILRKLTSIGLNPRESAIIEESIYDKYNPALRNSMIQSLLAAPGLVLSDSGQALAVIAVISTVTGIAWFTISLKEVKAKFCAFGTNVTKNMLQAFLTTVFIIGVISAYNIVETVFSIQQFSVSPQMQIVFAGLSLAVLCNMMVKLIKATIQHDANDAMLTGSADIAKRYYEQSLSSTHKAAHMLRHEHKLATANLTIATALNEYAILLRDLNFVLPDSLQQDIYSILDVADTDQEKVDATVIPILEGFLKSYESHIDDQKLQSKFDFAMHALNKLKREYENGHTVEQSLADGIIALALETIALLLDELQDRLDGTVG